VATATGTRTRVGARALTRAVVELERVAYSAGGRQLWQDLSLTLDRHEFLAVLGPNGAGKSTLLRLILGLATPSRGRVLVNGQPAASSRRHVGYVPQQRSFDPDLPLRGRDLVRLGLDGHRWGPLATRSAADRVEQAIAAVGADGFADRPIGRLSGGEQQRLRIAQALVRVPELILADEPLLSLDLAQQQTVVELLARQTRTSGAPVVFVTHDINPVLPHVDRVLYLTGSAWASGTVADVLTTETLSTLYQAPIDVLHVRDRIVVVGTPEAGGDHH
jgi:zinc/manganese transport system ATP-binding protein